ncbi:MAG: cytochrome c1 [Proteobacteria bacterium]|nr:cytochrome c1 [Pseudomonadota bacterium]
MKKMTLIVLGLTIASISLAAGGGDLSAKAHTNIRSMDSLRDGAKTYMNYCLGCHSMNYQRYNRVAKDLGITEDEMIESLILTDSRFVDLMEISMTTEQSKVWFNEAAAPDLTVIAKARGVDWLFNYLINFYQDETRPSGWNNTTFDSASMPHVLWEQQGIQQASFEIEIDSEGFEHSVFKGFELIQEGTLSPEEYQDLVRNLVNFLDYSSEPAKLIRLSYAPYVLLFMVIFTFLAYLLKLNYFRDVH